MNKSLEEFYPHLLGIRDPWEVTFLKRDSKNKEGDSHGGIEGQYAALLSSLWRTLDSVGINETVL